MANAKVTLNGVTLIDLTSDTVTANDILYGKVAHGSDGSSITGTISTVTHPSPSVSINTSTGVITASHTQSSGLVTGGTTSSTLNLSTVSGQTINPTESTQTAVASRKYTLGAVKIGAISSNYIGSNIAQRSAADLTASGSYINVPSGYYAAAASKNVDAGSVMVPPVTITANPTLTINSSTGVITGTVNKSSSISPVITSGYISHGDAGTVKASGSNTLQLSTVGTTTYTPTTTAQTIASGKYLTGVQTIAGDSNLIAANIAEGVTIFGVTGTHVGGPSRIAVQETLVYFRGASVNNQILNTFGSVQGATLIL